MQKCENPYSVERRIIYMLKQCSLQFVKTKQWADLIFLTTASLMEDLLLQLTVSA